jgi:hypothetical protein
MSGLSIRKKRENNIILPISIVISNASGFGWEYIGDGYFTRGDHIGFFTTGGRWNVE